MLARSQLTTALVAAMLMLSVVAIAPVATADDGNGESTDTVQTLENGEDLYLVFGADLGEQSLEEFLDDHLTDNPGQPADDQTAVSEVIQYQDVNQVNLNEEGAAASISIDGGNATSIQEATQQNDNVQVGESSVESGEADSHNTQFEDVGTVHLVMGNGDGQQFSGWGVADTKKGDEPTVTQSANAAVTQYQDVTQINYAEETTAFAFAENESEALAFQQLSQANQNLQEGAANATNVYQDTDDGYEKTPKQYSPTAQPGGSAAAASVDQAQDVDQANVNEAGAAVSIAVGQNSSATAVQLTEQTNLNEQLGTAEAANVLETMPGMNVATADMDDNDVVSTETEHVGDADKSGDKKETADPDQAAEASVAQYQGAEQFNINVESSAMALATNESTASAVQLIYQTNYNAQIASADAFNIYQGNGHQSGMVYTDETTVNLGGDEVSDNPMIAFDYDGEDSQLNDVEQHSSATIEQAQFVGQQNFANQSAAIAVADDGGDAASNQIIMQENRNVQYTAVGASSVIAVP